MKDFLESLAIMMHFADSSNSEEIQAKIIRDIERQLPNLSAEELDIVQSLCKSFDEYQQSQNSSINTFLYSVSNAYDKDKLADIFKNELTELQTQQDSIQSKMAFVKKISNMVEARKQEIGGPKL